MANLALHFLGTPLIERDGVPLQVVRHKAVALLAYLALTRRRHARQDVATLFWPEGDVTKRAGSLRSVVWELNRSLGDDWLDADRTSIGLRARTSLWIDVERFEQLLDPPWTTEGASARTGADRARAIEGVSIYRGDFLQGLTLRDSQELVQWQSSQAERFRRRIVQALDRLVLDLT